MFLRKNLSESKLETHLRVGGVDFLPDSLTNVVRQSNEMEDVGVSGQGRRGFLDYISPYFSLREAYKDLAKKAKEQGCDVVVVHCERFGSYWTVVTGTTYKSKPL